VLGLILDVSFKVLPKPVAEATLRLDLPQDKALEAMNAWAAQPLPISATCWQDDALTVRLSGAAAAVAAARQKIGGDRVAEDEAATFWSDLKEQRLAFFAGDSPLWRLSLPSVAPVIELPGDPLVEWNGSQRWWHADLEPGRVRQLAARAGGHATLFRGGDKSVGVFTPLPPPLMDLHRRLKAALDPHRIFNPGRLFPDL
jgi:glycolate oxidase FAD binding subunit